MRAPARTAAWGALACALAGAACSPPPRPSVDGYRATVTTIVDGVPAVPFDIAVRGENRRREAGPGTPVLILLGRELKAVRLDPASKSFSEVPYPQATDEMLPGFPLAPFFDHRAEAATRGVTQYRRESDEIFAGMVCALWRFSDRPDDDASPETVFWVASSLENLTIRMDRETPKPGGARATTSVRLTNIRLGADPGLFEVPKGFAPAVPR